MRAVKPVKPAPPFELTEQELRSALWLKLEAHMRERLASNRKRNDGDLDAAETAKTRGRNLELRHLLALNPNSGPEDTAG